MEGADVIPVAGFGLAVMVMRHSLAHHEGEICIYIRGFVPEPKVVSLSEHHSQTSSRSQQLFTQLLPSPLTQQAIIHTTTTYTNNTIILLPSSKLNTSNTTKMPATYTTSTAKVADDASSMRSTSSFASSISAMKASIKANKAAEKEKKSNSTASRANRYTSTIVNQC